MKYEKSKTFIYTKSQKKKKQQQQQTQLQFHTQHLFNIKRKGGGVLHRSLAGCH
jgi:hypothetical protein